FTWNTHRNRLESGIQNIDLVVVKGSANGHVAGQLLRIRHRIMGGKRSSLRWPVDMAHQGLRTMLVYPLESNGRSSLPTGQDLRNTGKTFRSFLNQSIEKGGGEEDGRDLLCLEQMLVIGNLQLAGRRDDDLFALQQWRPYLKC